MNYRIEISPLPQWRDARGEGVKKQIEKFFGFPVEKVWTRDIYTIAADITEKEAQKVAELLYNPVLQGWRVTAAKSENFQELPECEYLVAVGFRPGVTDNVGRSAKSAGRSGNAWIFHSPFLRSIWTYCWEVADPELETVDPANSPIRAPILSPAQRDDVTAAFIAEV